MLSEIRTIFFRTELQFIPFDEDGGFSRETARRLYIKLAEGDGDFAFENVDMTSSRPKLTTKSGGHLLTCELGKHMVAIEEKRSKSNVDDFTSIVKQVLAGMVSAESEQLDQLYLAFQETTIRGLVQPHGCDDAIDLLTSRLSHVRDKIGPFKRPPAFFGMRFTFPPYEIEENDGESEVNETEIPNPIAENSSESSDSGVDEDNSLPDELLHVTYQTWAEDISQVLIEVSAKIPLFGKAMADDESTHSAIENIRRTHAFLKKNAVEFLDAFDNNEDDHEE